MLLLKAVKRTWVGRAHLCKHVCGSFSLICFSILAYICKALKVKSSEVAMSMVSMQEALYVKHFLVTMRTDADAAYMKL